MAARKRAAMVEAYENSVCFIIKVDSCIVNHFLRCQKGIFSTSRLMLERAAGVILKTYLI